IKNEPIPEQKKSEELISSVEVTTSSVKAETKEEISDQVNNTSPKIQLDDRLPDGIDENVWTNILTKVRPNNASTEALLRAARPIDYDGKILKLGVYYTFHKEKLEGTPHRDILEEILEGVLGSPVRVIC